ncbi:HNH endonuclease [Lentzea sp. BCCO 10_0798]|uniref:HNH endonuclease n=1 Tax=Lentzea kristufekii TaxID=3095430 RepID=A0ABU4TX28_9PSEU|nr:HNH endonuclease [Lentzea sp. BCCO 10_0798]MDX8052851.1 HNH endonuclease [Lentzea sp. BCCO 10_0798]
MGLGDITADAVSTAMAEHDRLGLIEFCNQHGFDRFRNYVIADDTRRYGTRVITAAAHGRLPGQVPLTPPEVADDDLVNQLLEGLGFEVRELRPPKWTREELTLACSQLFSNDRVAQRVNDPAVQHLAAFLRRLPFHAPQDRGLNFRSVNSVQRKLFDLGTRLPEYKGKRTRGGALDEVIIGEFLADEAEMHRRAAAIRAEHEPKAWALFSAERKHDSDAGSSGVLGSSFVYDNNFSRSQELREGHVVVIHDDEDVLGIARIGRIDHEDGQAGVTKYVAYYGGTWRAVDGAISSDDLKDASTDMAAHDVIKPLDIDKVEAMLARVAVSLPSQAAEARSVAKIRSVRRIVTGKDVRGGEDDGVAPTGGRREIKAKARKGQDKFRKKLIQRYGHVCAITGRCPAEVLQAAHLRSFAEHETHNLDEGVLLRADVHLLFDSGLLAVDPTTRRVVLAPSLSTYPHYTQFDGAEFAVGPSEKAITDHFLAVTGAWIGQQGGNQEGL